MTTELLATDCPPIPEPDELTAFFWDAVNAHTLKILRCDDCERYVHWPRPVCGYCFSTNLTPAEVSGKGTLHTWTMPQQAFEPYYQTHMPYVLAVVELVEQPGLMFVTNIVDCAEEDLRLDMPVEVTFREVAPGYTLPLFKPATTV